MTHRGPCQPRTFCDSVILCPLPACSRTPPPQASLLTPLPAPRARAPARVPWGSTAALSITRSPGAGRDTRRGAAQGPTDNRRSRLCWGDPRDSACVHDGRRGWRSRCCGKPKPRGPQPREGSGGCSWGSPAPPRHQSGGTPACKGWKRRRQEAQQRPGQFGGHTTPPMACAAAQRWEPR